MSIRNLCKSLIRVTINSIDIAFIKKELSLLERRLDLSNNSQITKKDIEEICVI